MNQVVLTISWITEYMKNISKNGYLVSENFSRKFEQGGLKVFILEERGVLG